MAEGKPDVSVVVATHNRAGQLRELLDSLRGQTLPREQFEVVIVDDGSTDSTAELLRSEEARDELRLKVIRRERSAGPATARDQGWRAAGGELIAFTDDDCVADPGWLEAGIGACAERPGHMVQGRTEPPPGELESLGPWTRPFVRVLNVPEPDPGFQTCNIFYSRSLLERVDGFDTEAFGREPGGEDSDLAWRAIAAGARPAFAPDARVYHAVNRLGPIGKLRFAARWTTPLRSYVRHPELRRAHFRYRFFWKRTHYWLARAILAAALPGRRGSLRLWLLPVRLWLMLPYVRSLYARGKVEGGGPLLAPYYLLYDLVEMYAVARAAVRYRSPML